MDDSKIPTTTSLTVTYTRVDTRGIEIWLFEHLPSYSPCSITVW